MRNFTLKLVMTQIISTVNGVSQLYNFNYLNLEVKLTKHLLKVCVYLKKILANFFVI